MTGKGLRTEQQRLSMVNDIERGVAAGGETLPWQTDTCIGEWHYRRSISNNTVIRLQSRLCKCY